MRRDVQSAQRWKPVLLSQCLRKPHQMLLSILPAPDVYWTWTPCNAIRRVDGSQVVLLSIGALYAVIAFQAKAFPRQVLRTWLICCSQILALPSLAWIKMRKLTFLGVAKVTKGSWCDLWMCNCLYLWWCNKNNCWCPFSVHISEVRKVHFFSFRSKGFNEKVCLEEIFTGNLQANAFNVFFYFLYWERYKLE